MGVAETVTGMIRHLGSTFYDASSDADLLARNAQAHGPPARRSRSVNGCIGEFGGFWEPKPERLAKLHALGYEAADHFRQVLPDALDRFRHVIVLTHVPPFRESCWHEGKISDDSWLPFFTCKAVGDVLAEAMRNAPDRRMTVLCGHTHGSGEADILPNLRVLTGGAVYGNPCVQRVIEVE